MRIASLLPSATEIVCALGLRDRLVGVSHSCDWPADVVSLPRLTRTAVPVEAGSRAIDEHVRRTLAGQGALYELDLDALDAVAPDIVVSQRLCDVCAVSMNEVESALCSLASRPTLVDTEPSCLDDVFGDVRRVARAAGVPGQGEAVIAGLAARMRALERRNAAIRDVDRPRLAMIEWLDPPFDSGHWSPELVEAAGALDVLGPRRRPSRTIAWDDVLAAGPDVVLLSVCGFDIERTRREVAMIADDPGWRAVRESVEGRVLVMDGNAYFSRPGPRLVDAAEGLAHALHPAVHPPHPAVRVETLDAPSAG